MPTGIYKRKPFTKKHINNIRKSLIGRICLESTKIKLKEQRKGIPLSRETKLKISMAKKGKSKGFKGPHSVESKIKMSISGKGVNAGKNHPNWKHGLSKTKEYVRLNNRRSRIIRSKGGRLSMTIIYQVYTDNIKKFGKLTCYLCFKKISEYHLEHKIPLSRNGKNIYENLDIACPQCNRKKHNKTEEEYRKEIKNAKI